MRTKTLVILVASLAAAATLAGCHESAVHGTVQITARDYTFVAPDTFPQGPVKLVMTNEGPDIHHVQLIKIGSGHTYDELVAAIQTMKGEALPAWATWVAGPNAVAPGDTSTAWADLDKGTYALLCIIPDSEGTTHFKHGMIKKVMVGDDATHDDLPTPTLHLDAGDFSFMRHGTWNAGTHVVAMDNKGAQPHEVVAVALEGNASTMDFIMALGGNATGPPPGKLLGGLTGVEPGEASRFHLDLEPGRYGFICFFTDPASEMPHFLLGMTDEFTVT